MNLLLTLTIIHVFTWIYLRTKALGIRRSVTRAYTATFVWHRWKFRSLWRPMVRLPLQCLCFETVSISRILWSQWSSGMLAECFYIIKSMFFVLPDKVLHTWLNRIALCEYLRVDFAIFGILLTLSRLLILFLGKVPFYSQTHDFQAPHRGLFSYLLSSYAPRASDFETFVLYHGIFSSNIIFFRKWANFGNECRDINKALSSRKRETYNSWSRDPFDICVFRSLFNSIHCKHKSLVTLHCHGLSPMLSYLAYKYSSALHSVEDNLLSPVSGQCLHIFLH